MDRTALGKEICLWIESQINHPLRVRDVVAKTGYSKFFLHKLFVQETGKPLATYIRERKLHLILTELEQTEDKVMTIAMRYGFENQQSFTRLFTKRFNHPPGLWRKARQTTYQVLAV